MAATFSKQAVLNCLNETNGSLLTLSDVAFSSVSSGNFNGKNTKVTLTAVPDSGYTGTEDYSYNRLELTELDFNETQLGLNYIASNGQTIADIVSLINAFNQTKLTEADIQNWNTPVPHPPSGQTLAITLQADPQSYAWVGSATVEIRNIKPHIKTVAILTELDGLTLDHVTN